MGGLWSGIKALFGDNGSGPPTPAPKQDTFDTWGSLLHSKIMAQPLEKRGELIKYRIERTAYWNTQFQLLQTMGLAALHEYDRNRMGLMMEIHGKDIPKCVSHLAYMDVTYCYSL